MCGTHETPDFYSPKDKKQMKMSDKLEINSTTNGVFIKPPPTRDEYIAIATKTCGVYYDNRHDNFYHFVKDMDSRNFPREVLQYYFPVVINMKTKEITEIVGHEKTGEVVTNIVFNKKGQYSGHSFVLENVTEDMH